MLAFSTKVGCLSWVIYSQSNLVATKERPLMHISTCTKVTLMYNTRNLIFVFTDKRARPNFGSFNCSFLEFCVVIAVSDSVHSYIIIKNREKQYEFASSIVGKCSLWECIWIETWRKIGSKSANFVKSFWGIEAVGLQFFASPPKISRYETLIFR